MTPAFSAVFWYLRHIIFSFLLCLLGFSLFAETIELKNGKVVQGRVLIQDQNSIYLETTEGTTNINKSDIRAIDGKDYESPDAAEPSQGSGMAQEPVVSSALPPGKEQENEKDTTYDLAVIDIHAETPDYFRLAKENEIKVGDEVRACGNPQGFSVSFSKGIISAIRTNKGRFAPIGPRRPLAYSAYL